MGHPTFSFFLLFQFNMLSFSVNGTDTSYAGNYSCEVDWSIAENPKSITHYLEVQVRCDRRAEHAANVQIDRSSC